VLENAKKRRSPTGRLLLLLSFLGTGLQPARFADQKEKGFLQME